MNRTVLRTSLFWLCILALVVGFFLYQPHAPERAVPPSPGPQPVAAGPTPGPDTAGPKPTATTEAPLAPVQLTPEAMQSIGVKTGTVQRKAISDDIRAT